MSNVVWIGSYPDGVLRHQREGKRSRVLLSPTELLCNRLDQCFGVRTHSRLLAALAGTKHTEETDFEPHWSPSEIPICGLVQLDSVDCHHAVNVLTPLSEEERVLQLYYRDFGKDTNDFYSIRVRDVARLCDPLHIGFRRVRGSQNIGEAGLATITPNRPLFRTYFGDISGELAVNQDFGRILTFHRESGGVVEEVPVTSSLGRTLAWWEVTCEPGEIPVLLLPLPIALLVMNR